MWDEINLAVLAEAGSGRRHWSLDPRWETSEAGLRLNRSGVAAGREIPADLLLHRFAMVRDALLSQVRTYAADDWSAHSGPLAEYVMTVPNHDPYWHAAIHLKQLGER